MEIDGHTMEEWVRLVDDDAMRHRALRTLARFAEDAIPALSKLMGEHPGGDVRWLAREGLSQIGRPAAPAAEPRVFRRVSPDEASLPLGIIDDVNAAVTRREGTTTYGIAIPWPSLGLKEGPPTHAPRRLSVGVNDNDGKKRTGVQWFYGVRPKRDQLEQMGTLWIE